MSNSITAAVAYAPDFADAYHNRGIARLSKGDLDQAIADFSKAIGLNPRYVKAYEGRGNAWLGKGPITSETKGLVITFLNS